MDDERHAFVSHAHEDALVAGLLANALEAEQVPCWIAPRDISLGTSWDEAIVDALDHAAIFLLIFSRFSNSSRQVAKELTLADARSLDIRPIRIDQTVPSGGMEFHLSRPQWLDVSGLSSDSQMVESIMQQLQVGPHAQATALQQPSTPTETSAYANPDDWGRSEGWFGTRRRTRRSEQRRSG